MKKVSFIEVLYKVLDLCFSVLFFYACSCINLGSIWGSSNNGHISIFTALLPVSLISSYGSQIFYIFSLIKAKNIFYKIPGISNVLGTFFLKKNRSLYKAVYLFILCTLFYFFVFIYKNTVVYTIPWILCILYVLLTYKNRYSIKEVLFLSTWLSNAFGTVSYGMLDNFLSNEAYILLLPVSICERAIYIFVALIYFYYIKDLSSKKIILKIKNIYYNNKLIN